MVPAVGEVTGECVVVDILHHVVAAHKLQRRVFGRAGHCRVEQQHGAPNGVRGLRALLAMLNEHPVPALHIHPEQVAVDVVDASVHSLRYAAVFVAACL